jgi:hypothetical protein
MATLYTPLLKVALPTTGELSGTWGTVINEEITKLFEAAIAGTTTISVNGGDVTLTSTDGAADQARAAILVVTGAPGVSRNIIVPSASKAYIVVNNTNAPVVIKGSATTGASIPAGQRALVAWNGTDFVQVGASAGGANTQIQFNNNGSLAGSSNLTFNGTTLSANALSLSTALPLASGGTGATTAANARTNLGLGSIATQNSNALAVTGGTISGVTISSITDLAVSDGGTGASDAPTARANLGLGSMATQASNNISVTGGFITGITDIAVADGGTGASTAESARTNLGLGTGSLVQFASFGVGTTASGTTGEIRATNNITAYFSSDRRLKENIAPIASPLHMVSRLNGVRYDWTDAYIKDHGGEDGYFVRKHDIGVIAQEVEEVLPELVAENAEGYKAVRYERLVAVLIEAVKELKKEVDELKRDR